MHEAFWLPHQAPVVGNVAALVPHKGQRHLIEAAHLVVQRDAGRALSSFSAKASSASALERQVREHHLEKHVLLPGFRTDVLGCIKSFDLFVMSSVTEGLGTSLLDAMACSRAIVATRTGGIPEVVEDGETGRARAAARPRGDGAGDSWPCSRTTNGAAGWARPASRACSERFTVERMVAETAAVYARVAGRHHAADTAHHACARLKPQAFIMPRWQIEKS